jgi:hypothetical protein
MENTVINVTTATAGEYVSKDEEIVPMNLRIEITPDGQLGPISATDSNGHPYRVSLTMRNLGEDVCCCPDANGVPYCRKLPKGEQCVCIPK